MITDPKGKIFIAGWEEAHELTSELAYMDWFRLMKSKDDFLHKRYSGRGDMKWTYWNLQNNIQKNAQGKDGEAIVLGFLKRYFPEVNWQFPIPGRVEKGDGGDLRAYPIDPAGIIAINEIDENVIAIPEVKSYKTRFFQNEITVEDLYQNPKSHISVILFTDRSTGRPYNPTWIKERHIFACNFYEGANQIAIQGTIDGKTLIREGFTEEYKPGKWALRIHMNHESVIPISSFVSTIVTQGQKKIKELETSKEEI